MSQHDMEITSTDADTGILMRAAINAALQALASNNSGIAAPSTPYAYMFWVDTSTATPTLKQRNATNTAWVPLFQLSASQWLFVKDVMVNGVTIGMGSGSVATNVAIGLSALLVNTSGAFNTALGSYTLAANLGGSSNTAIGSLSLSANTSGSANVAVGNNTLQNNISGSGNTAVGGGALPLNTASNNTAVGNNSLAANVGGTSNTAVGYWSLLNNTTGSKNTAVGEQSGRYTSAGVSNQTCNNSVFIGYDSRPNADGDTNEIVIGYQAMGAGSNTVTIGNSSITKTVLSGVMQKRSLDAAPASATATGITGEIRVTATHIYVCTATNTWVRTALTTW